MFENLHQKVFTVDGVRKQFWYPQIYHFITTVSNRPNSYLCSDETALFRWNKTKTQINIVRNERV